MNLKELFLTGGRGVIATSDKQGAVNVAVYAMPHVINDKTLAWGMSDGRTYKNISQNPRAAYLYMNPGNGFSGVRIGLVLKEMQDSGEMLETIRTRTAEIVNPDAAKAVRHVAYFVVSEIRALI